MLCLLLSCIVFHAHSLALFAEPVLQPTAEAIHAPDSQRDQTNPSFSLDEWKSGEGQPNEVPEPHFSELFAKMIGLLCLTLLIFFAFIYIYKKFIQGKIYAASRKNSRIEVVERYGLSNKATVYILKIDNREFAFLESPHGIAMIQNPLEQAPHSSSFQK